jgi:hypothetical protein
MKYYLLIAAALIAIALGITGIALWGSRSAAAAQEQLRVVEERALAAEQIATALRIDKLSLERELNRTAEASQSFQAQLEAVKRAAPTAKVESVVLHRGDAFEVPLAVDSDSTQGAVTPSSVAAPLLSVSTSEARLRTDAGTVAVVGETTVECVGGGCVLGWKHVNRWSADATQLFVRDEKKPLLRGWGIGGSLSCARSGCGLGPHLDAPVRRWTSRQGREIALQASGSLTVVGEVVGTLNASIRF